MDKNANILGVWGGRGSGKSTRIKETLKDNKKYSNRVVVFDPIGDYADERGFRGYTTLKSLYTALKRDWNKGFKFVLIAQRGENPEVLLDQLANDLFTIQQPYRDGKDGRQITLVVEEMALSYPERTLSKDQQSFKELINLGRHYGVNILGASQRMAEVKKNFVGNCAEHFFFRMGSHADYQSVSRIVGPEYTKKLRSLETHSYIKFANGAISDGKNKCNFK